VLEFDEFMKIEGCTTKDKHLFVGSGEKRKGTGSDGEELVEAVRYVDFYLKQVQVWHTSTSRMTYIHQTGMTNLAIPEPTSTRPPRK